MSLNFDSLAAAMPWIKSRRDLISFMSTRSDLYTAGIPILLGLHHRIHDGNLRPFHRFLITHAPTSFLSLRSLEMSFYDIAGLDQDRDDILVDILRRCQDHLQHLNLSGAILRTVPLQQSFASLSALRSLELSDNGGFGFEGRSCYPKLIHLTLTTVHPLRLSLLLPAFPNLETLKVERSGSHEFIGAEDELRDENIRFQLECPSQGWRLSSLYGDVGSLYTMGLQARVPNVTIGGELPSHFDDFGLSELLAPLRPLQLSLSQDAAAFDTAWLSNAITVGWEGLVRLDFRVECLYPGEPVARHEERLDRLFHDLHLISTSTPDLSCINITFDSDIIGGLDPLLDFLDGLQMDELAARAVQAIPNLRAAKFVIRTGSTRTSYWISEKRGELMPVLSQDDSALAGRNFDAYIEPFIQKYQY